MNTLRKSIPQTIKNINLHQLKYVGEGESGIVYRLNNKIIKLSKSNDPLDFIDDIILSKLQSYKNYFLKLYHYEAGHYYISDYFEGVTLNEYGLKKIAEIENLPVILQQKLINALDFALSRGVIPDDLHLNNIMINEKTMDIKIIDVGRFRLCNEKFLPIISKKFKETNVFYVTLRNSLCHSNRLVMN